MALPSKSSHDPPCQNTGESKQSLQVEEEKFGRAWESFKPNTGFSTKSPSSRITKLPFIQELQYSSKDSTWRLSTYLGSFTGKS